MYVFAPDVYILSILLFGLNKKKQAAFGTLRVTVTQS